MKRVFVIALMLVLSACSNSSDAHRALNAAGFTDIETHGFSFLSCRDDGFYSTKFTATNPLGHKVEGAVCSGLIFKNASIRY